MKKNLRKHRTIWREHPAKAEDAIVRCCLILFSWGTSDSIARAVSEGFCSKLRFGNCRNTLCTSNFSNRWIGEKYPAKAEGAMIRCCLSASLPALRGSCRTGPPASGRRPRARRWPCRCGRRRRSRHGERAAWGSSRSGTRQRRRRGRR